RRHSQKEKCNNTCHCRYPSQRPPPGRKPFFLLKGFDPREYGFFQFWCDRYISSGTDRQLAKCTVLFEEVANFGTDRNAVHKFRRLGVIQAPIEIGDDRVFNLIGLHCANTSSVPRAISFKSSVSSSTVYVFSEGLRRRRLLIPASY